jgi:hypothetical protein
MRNHVAKRQYSFVHFLWNLSVLVFSFITKISSQEDESLNLMLNSYSTNIPTVMHRDKIKAARELLQSGKCNHVYLDMGTNVGVQIRKLYQPLSYTKSYVWPPIWNSFFGKYDIITNNRSDVCAFGFEPNPLHNKILNKTENFYQKHGFNVIIFRETAISTSYGNASFIRDFSSDPKNLEFGGTMFDYGQGNSSQIKQSSYDVFTLDIARFLGIEIAKRKGQTSNSRTIAKMDIEGGEYTVLPTMLTQSDSLCSIAYIGIEWHRNMDLKSSPPETKTILPILQFITKQAKNCQTVIHKIDDESYGQAGKDPVSLDQWT